MEKIKIQIEICGAGTQERDASILCTECGEPYEPASGYADIRCANCGNHQSPI